MTTPTDRESFHDEFHVSNEAVLRATGQDREAWFAMLDAWNSETREHREIAAWLVDEHGVAHWWAQTITGDYEQARGLRPPGGHRDGTFDVNASKTVAVPVRDLFEAFMDPRQRERWLPGAKLHERTVQPERSARFDWEDGSTRVNVYFSEKRKEKSQVALQHERIADRQTADEKKKYWREGLSALKSLLEG